MRLVNILRLRLRSLLARTRVERELDEELRYHLERQIEADVAAGMTRADAERRARRQTAGVEHEKEVCRDERGVQIVDNLFGDVRFAIRQLRKNPGFTAAAIFMLALGLCASVAIFAFVDAALLKPLPYQDPSRLVGVFETAAMFPRSNLSYPDYLDWKAQNTVFSAFEGYNRTGFIVSTPTGAEPARGTRVTAGFFRTLGVTPVLGRDFRLDEDQPSAARSTLLSHAAWQTRFGGDPAVLGRTVTLDGQPVVIVGVLPRTFHFAPGEPAEFWTTLQATNPCDVRRSCHSMYGVARLKPGITIDAALSNVQAIAKQLETAYPTSNRGQGAALAPLSEVIVGDIRPILLVLLVGAGLLLLIASVNAASLLLVRSEGRTREMAVRRALGASSTRLVVQFATEAAVLVAGGAALGLFAAHWLAQLLTGLIPADLMARLSFLQDLGLNLRVWAFAGVIALFAALLFALIPSLRLVWADSRAGLAEGSRGSAGQAWRRLGSRLVVVELAIAVVLLVSAGLLGQSLYRVLRVDVGMQPDRLATIYVAAPRAGYEDDTRRVALQREIVARMSALPGVEAAGISSQIPLSGNGNTTWFRVLGRPWKEGEHLEAPFREVTPAYFKTLGATLVRGRAFDDTEDASKPLVVIINQALARVHFPNEDPLGKQLAHISAEPQPMQIVGIVEDIKEGPLDVPTPPVMYVPYGQSVSSNFGVVVRTTQAPATLLPALPAVIREINRGIVTDAVMTMRDRIDDSPSAYLHRSSAALVGGFAAVALLLGVVGLYGVVAYSVSQRRREVGVRMALGAQRGAVYQLILKEAGWLTGAGIAIGLVCALGAGLLMRGLLFGVRSWDLPTLAGVTVLLGVSALLASYIPARRAASVNPVEALRAD